MAISQTSPTAVWTALLAALALAGCAGPGNSPWGPSCPYGSGPGTLPPVVVPPQPGQGAGWQPVQSTSATSPSANTAGGVGQGTSTASGDPVTIRGQSPTYDPYMPASPSATGPDGYSRAPQPVSGGAPVTTGYPAATYGQPAAPAAQPTYTYQPPAVQPGVQLPPPPGVGPTEGIFVPPYPGFQPPSNFPPEYSATPTPLDIFVEETRTGRFMFGVTVNSDAGVAGQITIDERNFDITRVPTSWDDLTSGGAFRGAGQGFRIEAQPGDQVQRYLVSFTEPYFLNTNISFSASAFYYDRNFYDWDESRYGGRLMWGYRLTPDLSVAGALRAENINIFDPRVAGVDELDEALGRNDLFSGKITLTHDTRDLPFMPTEGHLIELGYEQAFGSFDYPRGTVDYSQYFLLRQRPDGSGRHTLGYTTRLGFSGSDTPIFENFFAGGFSTLRGYSFRGASPIEGSVRVGGEFQWLNSVEYFFPITADDMVKGTFFVDFGTVERDITIQTDNFRVAPGVGLRINVPALGPAPLAFDFAFPIASAPGDDEQLFSFFFGAMR